MKLDIKDAEELLGIPAMTIQRWIRQGKIPVREEGGVCFFRRKELEKWARNRQLPLRQDAIRCEPEEAFDEKSLPQAMRRGGVFFDVPGETVPEVLREVAGLAPIPSKVDAEALLERLMERERMASTGIGGGVAIPHPRYPIEGVPERPTITTAFLRRPIDFNSIDGKPVFVVFLMLSPSTNIHLYLLSRLSLCLRDPEFMATIMGCHDEETLLAGVTKAVVPK